MNDYAISNLISCKENIHAYASFANERGEDYNFFDKIDAAENALQNLIDYLKKCEQH